jgi:hypothetical protein
VLKNKVILEKNLYFFEVNGERTGMTFHDPRLLGLVTDAFERW